jgi:hypothetical protein
MNEMDRAGYTPLLTAVFYRSKECVEFILSKIVGVQIMNQSFFDKFLSISDIESW